MKINLFFLPILLVTLLLVINEQALGEPIGSVEQGLNYNKTLLSINQNGSKTYQIITVPERIISGTDQNGNPIYSNYLLTVNNDIIQVETQQGSVVLHKNFCSYSFYNNGFIEQGEQELFSDSIVPKQAVVNTSKWSNVNEIINQACVGSYTASNNEINLSATKTKAGLGYVTYHYIYKDEKWKTELEVYNNSTLTDRKFGFTQTIDLNRDIIQFGNTTVNLQNKNGTEYDRDWTIAHKGKIIDLLNGHYFDFDLAFDNLNKIIVYAYQDSTSKLVFDFINTNQILLPNETLILDPTYGSAGTDFQTFLANAVNADCSQGGGGILTTPSMELSDSTASDRCRGSFVEFDITTIDDDAIVSSINMKVSTGSTSNGKDCVVTRMNTGTQPSTRPSNAINSLAVWNEINNSTEYATADCSANLSAEVFALSATALTDMENILASGQNWIGYGFRFDPSTRDAGVNRISTPSSFELEVTYTTGTPPDAVDDLVAFVRSSTQIDLEWSFPSNGTGTFQAFVINYTTPFGNPLTHLANTTNTYYNVTGLVFGTQYSFRVSSATELGFNATGNIANATTLTTTYATPPTNLVVYGTVTDNKKLNLQWISGPMASINGYRIERETPIGSGFSIIVTNTTNTNTYYNNTGLTTNIIYNYRVYSMNQSGISTPSNLYDMTTYHLPDKVDDLVAVSTSLSSIDLSWTPPTSYAPEILGYQINYTTPFGNPLTTITDNTGSPVTEYEVTGLTIGAETSFRVSAITVHGRNTTGNIANATTFSEFTIGELTLNTTPIGELGVYFIETEYNSTTINVNVIYPNTISDLRCDIAYQNLNQNRTYTGLTSSTYDATHDNSTFRFVDVSNEIITIDCWDSTEPDTNGQHIITQTSFPFLDDIELFREGAFGISSSFGAFDIITLIVIIVSMIGFNKENPAAGIIIATMILGAASFFQVIILETTVFGALALVVAIAIAVTRKT